jgi:RNA polymerase sigma-70 factor (ECF subfamily)
VTPPTVQRAVDAAFREEWGRVLATLIRRTGDWDLAEECAQEAFTQALGRWAVDGVPRRPGAWLTTVAGNRAIDRLRRSARGDALLEQTRREAPPQSPDEEAIPELGDETEEIEDDRLRLIFTCCHPALALESRVALTLRSLAGLTTTEIARAFLVPEATMAKRLTRARAKIAAAGIPYRVPPAHLLPQRTAGVLAVLYLMFNEGHSASSGTGLIRAGLCEEAIRLGRALQQLLPDEPEVMGALALMLLHHSRRHARVGGDGELITLEEQDRRHWDRTEIQEGSGLLETALRRRQVGPYQLQAAIVACHARAASAADTDWREIAGLYALLEEHMPSPVVTLNRAVAVAMTGDIGAGLAIVDELSGDARLRQYHLLDATRADLLRRRGDQIGAAAAYGRALGLAPSEVERRYLQRRLNEVSESRAPERPGRARDRNRRHQLTPTSPALDPGGVATICPGGASRENRRPHRDGDPAAGAPGVAVERDVAGLDEPPRREKLPECVQEAARDREPGAAEERQDRYQAADQWSDRVGVDEMADEDPQRGERE